MCLTVTLFASFSCCLKQQYLNCVYFVTRLPFMLLLFCPRHNIIFSIETTLNSNTNAKGGDGKLFKININIIYLHKDRTQRRSETISRNRWDLKRSKARRRETGISNENYFPSFSFFHVRFPRVPTRSRLYCSFCQFLLLTVPFLTVSEYVHAHALCVHV